VPLSSLLSKILDDYGFQLYDAGSLTGFVDGYALDRIMSARSALQPLELAFFIDSFENGDGVVFAPRGARAPVATIDFSDLVEVSARTSPII
jgi:hypothetical protein